MATHFHKQPKFTDVRWGYTRQPTKNQVGESRERQLAFLLPRSRNIATGGVGGAQRVPGLKAVRIDRPLLAVSAHVAQL